VQRTIAVNQNIPCHAAGTSDQNGSFGHINVDRHYGLYAPPNLGISWTRRYGWVWLGDLRVRRAVARFREARPRCPSTTLSGSRWLPDVRVRGRPESSCRAGSSGVARTAKRPAGPGPAINAFAIKVGGRAKH